MALETLKGELYIGGYAVVDLEEAKAQGTFRDPDGSFNWEKYDEYRKDFPISIAHDKNMISFRIQNGPIKEVGENGCQVDTLIHAAKLIIEKLNENFQSSRNMKAIGHLNLALAALQKRKEDREKRGVEGFSKA